MNYHTKTILHTCQAAMYTLIGLLSLAVVVGSCTRAYRQQPGLNAVSNSTTSLRVQDIRALQELFGFFEKDGAAVGLHAYLQGFAKQCQATTHPMGHKKWHANMLTVQDFEKLEAIYRPVGYAKEVLKVFITTPLKHHLDPTNCHKDPRIYVVCLYVAFTHTIHKVLNNQNLSGNEKLAAINKALDTFKKATAQVRHHADYGLKIKIQNQGVWFKKVLIPQLEYEAILERFNPEDYRLSTTFDSKLNNIVTYLEACITQNKALIQGNQDAQDEE